LGLGVRVRVRARVRARVRVRVRVSNCLEAHVGEAEHEQVHHELLAQVVIDPVELLVRVRASVSKVVVGMKES